jgi:hypothetical protein
MTEQRDRLMAALFDRPGKEHIDVKFLVGPAIDADDPEAFCRVAANMIDLMHNAEGDETFEETFA